MSRPLPCSLARPNNMSRFGVWPLLALLMFLPLGCGGEEGVAGPPPSHGPEGEWPQWRGPSRDGKVVSEGLRGDWSEDGPAILWRRPLGEGFGAIAVAAERLLVLYADGRQESLAALDARSGETLWELPFGRTFRENHGDGPRTSPLVADGMVYSMGSRRLVAASLEDGGERWSRELDEPPQWGFSASPLLVDGRLIVQGWLKGEEGTVFALDPATGATLWAAESGHPGYASPLATELAGRRQILSFLASGLTALDPATGERLWQHPWSTAYGVNAADPVLVGDDRVFISSGYDSGACLVRVSADAEGAPIAEELWRERRMKNHFSSSVVVGNTLYGFDTANLVAFDLEEGEHLWRQRGLGKGSLIVAGEHLLVLGEEGQLVLVEPTPDAYHELGRLQILEHGSWTPPTLAGHWLFARDHHEIVAVDLGGE